MLDRPHLRAVPSSKTNWNDIGTMAPRPGRVRPQKSPAVAGLFFHSGGGIRTRDLRVMSPTSYQTAPPRVATSSSSKEPAPPAATLLAPRRLALPASPSSIPAHDRVAVVDIGTNSTRLLVADVSPAGGVSELVRRSTVTRLGEGVDASGSLSAAAVDRVLRDARGVPPTRSTRTTASPTSPCSPPPCATPPTAPSSPSGSGASSRSTRACSPGRKRRS